VVDHVNTIIGNYENEDMGPQILDPVAGSVAFGSGYYGWGFHLMQFAKMYGKKYGMDPNFLVKKLWGENYFNPGTSKF